MKYCVKLPLPILLLAFLFLSTSCGGGGGGSSPEPPEPPPPPPPEPQTPQALANPIPTAITQSDIVVDAVTWITSPATEDPVEGGATNAAPARVHTFVETPEENSRFFYTDERGIIYQINDEDQPQVFLDLRTREVALYSASLPNESGLLGLAFHPQFAVEEAPGYGKFYTPFTSDSDSGQADFIEANDSVHESVIVEWTMEDHSSATFSGSYREVIRVGEFAPNHNIGTIGFNPWSTNDSADFGILYASFGDGGSRMDPRDHGQNRSTPLGTIIRVDPLGGGDDEKYGIPSDNPFVGSTSALNEIYAFGFRHPQHFSWDNDGRMFAIDIGQDQIEEVNIVVPGGNFGWRLREGRFNTAFGVDTDDTPGSVYALDSLSDGMVYPVAQYDHDEGHAISSGYVYRGTAIPELVGKYVFTELVRGRLFYIETEDLSAGDEAQIFEIEIRFDGEVSAIADIAGMFNTYGVTPRRVDLRLAVDKNNELYLLTKGDGKIRRLRPIASD